MADFPDSIYSPRTKENVEGVEYDPDETNTLFAEDVEKDDDEIVAIETILGTLPSGEYNTVREWLEALEAAGGPENFGNCDGGSPVSNYGAIDPIDGEGV